MSPTWEWALPYLSRLLVVKALDQFPRAGFQRKHSHERCVYGLDELVIVDRGSVTEPICQNSLIEPVRSRGIGYLGRLVGSRVENEEGVGLKLKAEEAVARTDNCNMVKLMVVLVEREIIESDSDDFVFERGFVVDGVEGIAGG